MANIHGIEVSSEVYDLEDTSARSTATTASQTATTASQTATTASQTATTASNKASDAEREAGKARMEIGDITSLETTNQDDLVSAINEVKTEADSNEANIGNLANLRTTAKSNLVAAINEVAGDGGDPSVIGDLDNLETTTKSDLVSAINEVFENFHFLGKFSTLSAITSANEHDIALIISAQALPSYTGISLSGKTPPYTLFKYEKDGSNELKWIPLCSSTDNYIKSQVGNPTLYRKAVDTTGTITLSSANIEAMFGTGTIARGSIEIKAIDNNEFKTVAYLMFNIVGGNMYNFRGLSTPNVSYSGKTATITGLPTTGSNYQIYPTTYGSEVNLS